MKIENNYLILEPTDYIPQNKKISGHTFVALLGLDPFKKPGDALLEMHRFIKPEVDPKWLKRGSFAEQIINRVYSRDYKTVTYDAKEIKYDNFPEVPNFGGIIDIELPEKQTLIEVKSKSLDKYESIINNPPQSEIYQAALYAFLRGYDKFIMEWVFFDDQTEQEIFNDQRPTTLQHIKRYTKICFVDRDDMNEKMKLAANYVKAFRLKRILPLNLVSPEVIKTLQEKIEKGKFPTE